MLVLSRRAEQRILFPHLGICINVLQVKGKLVKLGVDAPKSVRVIRSELADPTADAEIAEPQLDHTQRNALNLLHLRLQAIQCRLGRGETLDAQEVLDSLLDSYSAMDHAMGHADSANLLHRSDRPIRLLVVEDCDNERQLMAYVLASNGFDVEVAPDGLVALQQLRAGSTPPDCVLMDMQMPHADGLETLLEIRNSQSLQHLKVFAVTGTKRDPRYEPVGHGWDGWFRKPLNVPALVERLRADLQPSPKPVRV